MADAAVIGVPDDNVGEVPRAYVVLKQGQSVEKDDILKFVEGKSVASHMCYVNCHVVTCNKIKHYFSKA